MLGVNTSLETEKEHNDRSSGISIHIFERARLDNRILLTTSKNLLKRSNCPPSYLVSPKYLEVSCNIYVYT